MSGNSTPHCLLYFPSLLIHSPPPSEVAHKWLISSETASGVFVCSTPARGSVAPSVRIIASTTPSTIYSGSSTSASNVTSSSSSLTTTSTSTCVTASPKSRKRKGRSKQWARKKMKAQRNSGKEYTSAKKLLVSDHTRTHVHVLIIICYIYR